MKNFLCESYTGDVAPFIDKLKVAIERAYVIFGNVSCKMQYENGVWELMIFPSGQELVGGSEDGKIVFPGFNLNVGKFKKLFDKGCRMSFNCMSKNITEHLMFVGKIDGHAARVAVLVAPPLYQKPVEKIHLVGVKKGIIENN